jgi:hypothetical protein
MNLALKYTGILSYDFDLFKVNKFIKPEFKAFYTRQQGPLMAMKYGDRKVVTFLSTFEGPR